MSSEAQSTPPFWTDTQGKKLVCTEKLRMLRENEAEVQQVIQDAYDDAILMGVDPVVVRARFMAILNQTNRSFLKDAHYQKEMGD